MKRCISGPSTGRFYSPSNSFPSHPQFCPCCPCPVLSQAESPNDPHCMERMAESAPGSLPSPLPGRSPPSLLPRTVPQLLPFLPRPPHLTRQPFPSQHRPHNEQSPVNLAPLHLQQHLSQESIPFSRLPHPPSSLAWLAPTLLPSGFTPARWGGPPPNLRESLQIPLEGVSASLTFLEQPTGRLRCVQPSARHVLSRSRSTQQCEMQRNFIYPSIPRDVLNRTRSHKEQTSIPKSGCPSHKEENHSFHGRAPLGKANAKTVLGDRGFSFLSFPASVRCFPSNLQETGGLLSLVFQTGSTRSNLFPFLQINTGEASTLSLQGRT